MANADRSSTLSPFQRFEKLAKALFAVPKKEPDEEIGEVPRKKPAKRNRIVNGR